MVVQSAIAVAHIPPYDSLINHPLINKYMTGVFSLGIPNPKLSFAQDVDILSRHFEQQGVLTCYQK